MALNPNTIAPTAREQYLKIGKRFSSDDTLKQANKTLAAVETYGPQVAVYGFGSDDRSRLQDARDGLVTAGVGRETARAGKKGGSSDHAKALKAGKVLRARAIAVLENTYQALLFAGAPQDLLSQVRGALEQTSSIGSDINKLADQLELIKNTIALEAVAPEVAKRGGTLAAELGPAVVMLRQAGADRSTVPGTPEESELLDVFDGIIVTLCRAGRKAARAAAKAQGAPAIATAFELTFITHGEPKKEEPVPPV